MLGVVALQGIATFCSWKFDFIFYLSEIVWFNYDLLRSQEQSRRFDDNKRVGNNGDNFSRNNRDNYSSRDRDNRDRRGGGGGGRDRQRSRSRSRDRSRRDESDSKQEQPRDIDMRQEKSDSYSPTRPDYKPTIKKGGKDCFCFVKNSNV